MADFEFNYQLSFNFLPTEWMTTCFEQRCYFLFKTYYLLNLQHILLSVVLRNDGKINVVDHARVVKTFKFERLLIGYISKCKDRLSISIVASISQPYWHCLLVPSAANFCKQFGTRSGRTKCQAWLGSKLFDTLMVFPKEFFEKKVIFL